jgi:hypothetical protein
MPFISLRYNPDGTARATLVDGAGDPVEGFDWAVNVLRDDAGYAVQLEKLDGSEMESVTTVDPADMMGAQDQAVRSLIGKATGQGILFEGYRVNDEQEEPI